MSVDEAELLVRIEAADPDQMDGTAAHLFRAAGELETRYEEARGVRTGGAHLWKGVAATAWGDHLDRVASRLSLAAYGIRQFAAALKDMAGAARKAKADVGAAEIRLREAVFFPDGDPQHTRERQAQAARQAATEEFHTAEQRVRTRLWRLGDLADAGPPPTVEVVEPRRGIADRIFGSIPGPVQKDAEGNPLAYDEDGTLVPGYRGDVAARGEVLEAELPGNLTRVVSRLAIALRGVSKEEAAVRRVMAEIRKDYGWRPSHIGEHILEWYGGSEVLPHMEQEWARMVAEAVVKQGGTFEWSHHGQQATAVLFDVPGKRKTLAVFFYRGGDRDGEFMTAYGVEGAKRARLRDAAEKSPVKS